MDTRGEWSIIAALEHATHAVGLWVDQELRQHGVSQAEAHVLAYLARHGGGTINELHGSFGQKRSTLTGLVDRLEGRGWLRRVAHASSRREVALELTEAGRAVAGEVAAALGALERGVRALAGDAAIEGYLKVLVALEFEIEEGGR